MTSEYRALFGLKDLKAITFECTSCGARLTIPPAKLSMQKLTGCPNCSNSWLSDDLTQSNRVYSDAISRFVNALKQAMGDRNPENDGVRILFEFYEGPAAE